MTEKKKIITVAKDELTNNSVLSSKELQKVRELKWKEERDKKSYCVFCYLKPIL